MIDPWRHLDDWNKPANQPGRHLREVLLRGDGQDRGVRRQARRAAGPDRRGRRPDPRRLTSTSSTSTATTRCAASPSTWPSLFPKVKEGGFLAGRRLLPQHLPARPEVRAHPGLPVRGVLRRGGRGPDLRPAAQAVRDAEGHRRRARLRRPRGRLRARTLDDQIARRTEPATAPAPALLSRIAGGPEDREADPMSAPDCPRTRPRRTSCDGGRPSTCRSPRPPARASSGWSRTSRRRTPSTSTRRPSAETSRTMTIHHRSRWQHTPMLNELDDEELAEITPENGWFVFAVVRHPAARFWSGWQSKLLLHEPYFSKRYRRAPGRASRSPRPTWSRTSTPSCAASAADPAAPIFHDRHFRSQTRLLKTDRVPYSRVYQTAQFGELMRDLEAHLRPLGLERMPALRRSNETPSRRSSSCSPPRWSTRSRSTTPPTSSSSATPRSSPPGWRPRGSTPAPSWPRWAASPSGPSASARSASGSPRPARRRSTPRGRQPGGDDLG